MNTPENEDVERLKRAAEALGEHYDAVHIFASRQDDDGTMSASWGVGNWFTRYGQVRDWLVKREEETKVGIRKEDEDGD